MAEIIEVNTSILNQDIADLEAALQKIKDKMNQMFYAVGELDQMWSGPANQVFRLQFNSDKESMTELCANIESMIESMRYARTEYDKCEAQVQSTIASIRI